ncbi:MAG: MFS transporter [Paracoccaceae bacterium]
MTHLNSTAPDQNQRRSNPARARAPVMFPLFCLGGFLLAVAYGTTFLLALLVLSRGGDEGDTALIFAAATVCTVMAVLGSGHLSDAIGAPRAVGVSGLILGIGCGGFAMMPGFGPGMLVCGALLGVGWGTFYTISPIVVAGFTQAGQRTRRFAMLSGCMMAGIGTGPLLGRLVAQLSLPVEAVFWVAAFASAAGGLGYLVLRRGIVRGTTAQGGAGVYRLTRASTLQVLRSDARWPILMVGLGGAVFGGLSSFQTVYAAVRGLDYAVFFFGFMFAVVAGRLGLAGLVTRQNPYRASVVLTFLMVLAVLMLLGTAGSWELYLSAAMMLGAGYGLTYSVINGLAANEAPREVVAQALLLFSLSYFVGVFGFAAVAGKLVALAGVDLLLWATLAIAVLNCGVALGRLIARGWR